LAGLIFSPPCSSRGRDRETHYRRREEKRREEKVCPITLINYSKGRLEPKDEENNEELMIDQIRGR